MTGTVGQRPGRPPGTSRRAVTHAALELFAERGFEETTVDDIADALGVSRRTLFRYFASKNDMVWGEFDWVLARLRRCLEATDADEPLHDALRSAVVESNRYEDLLKAGIDSALLGLGRASTSELTPEDLSIPAGFARRLGATSSPAEPAGLSPRG